MTSQCTRRRSLSSSISCRVVALSLPSVGGDSSPRRCHRSRCRCPSHYLRRKRHREASAVPRAIGSEVLSRDRRGCSALGLRHIQPGHQSSSVAVRRPGSPHRIRIDTGPVAVVAVIAAEDPAIVALGVGPARALDVQIAVVVDLGQSGTTVSQSLSFPSQTSVPPGKLAPSPSSQSVLSGDTAGITDAIQV